jgi:hypothetical protein
VEEVRVLAFTATYGAGPRPEMVQSVVAQRFGGHLEHLVSWHNPFPEGDLRNVAAQLQRGREVALAGGYDALLVVEHDMRLPADALQHLWDARGPVAYGAYLFRHGANVLNLLESYGPRARNVGESLSLRRDSLRRAMRRRSGWLEVSGLGFGCTLIRRAVLEAIPFRENGDRPSCVDMAFAQDCLTAGVRQVGRLDVRCGHWDGARWLEPVCGQDGGQA